MLSISKSHSLELAGVAVAISFSDFLIDIFDEAYRTRDHSRSIIDKYLVYI